jgi:formylglycine-generating enzyme required for sulfatase activity
MIETDKLNEMILIPAGEFVFGIEELARNMRDRIPPRTIYLPAFYIDRFEVTNAQYRLFIEATGHTPPSHWKGENVPEGRENHPVVNVSYYDALAYCEWADKRLPREAEWEKACRGTDARDYPWGNLIASARCNSYEMGIHDTTPVDHYPRGQSPYGVWDMVGNVWEWTSDWYDAAQSMKVVRGGSYNIGTSNLRCTLRYGIRPERKRPYCGFRCVRDA